MLVMDTKFGMNVSYRMLLNAAKFHTAFTIFELLRENQLGGGNFTPYPLPHSDLGQYQSRFSSYSFGKLVFRLFVFRAYLRFELDNNTSDGCFLIVS